MADDRDDKGCCHTAAGTTLDALLALEEGNLQHNVGGSSESESESGARRRGEASINVTVQQDYSTVTNNCPVVSSDNVSQQDIKVLNNDETLLVNGANPFDAGTIVGRTKTQPARSMEQDDDSSDDSSADSFWAKEEKKRTEARDDSKLPSQVCIAPEEATLEDTDDSIDATPEKEKGMNSKDSASSSSGESDSGASEKSDSSENNSGTTTEGSSSTAGEHSDSPSETEDNRQSKKRRQIASSAESDTSSDDSSISDHPTKKKKQHYSDEEDDSSLEVVTAHQTGNNYTNHAAIQSKSKGKIQRDFDPKVGDRVFAMWENGQWYWGKITNIVRRKKAHYKFYSVSESAVRIPSHLSRHCAHLLSYRFCLTMEMNRIMCPVPKSGRRENIDKSLRLIAHRLHVAIRSVHEICSSFVATSAHSVPSLTAVCVPRAREISGLLRVMCMKFVFKRYATHEQ